MTRRNINRTKRAALLTSAGALPRGALLARHRDVLSTFDFATLEQRVLARVKAERHGDEIVISGSEPDLRRVMKALYAPVRWGLIWSES